MARSGPDDRGRGDLSCHDGRGQVLLFDGAQLFGPELKLERVAGVVELAECLKDNGRRLL